MLLKKSKQKKRQIQKKNNKDQELAVEAPIEERKAPVDKKMKEKTTPEETDKNEEIKFSNSDIHYLPITVQRVSNSKLGFMLC